MVICVVLIGYAALLVLMGYQWRKATTLYKFEWRMTHGKRRVYVRSRATGRVIMQTLNVWDLLSLGI